MSCIPTEQGYDPFNPEVVKPQDQHDGKSPAPGDFSGALELVNRAIEEVRSEVEREQKKLCQIGDEPYTPREKKSSSHLSDKNKTATSHQAYDPGSYQITSGGYNPTPGCSKYTLDSGPEENNSNSMEYVPTSLKKPSAQTHAPKPSSPPISPNRSNSTLSFKCKYTLDNSKPSTDMEYDPLSNYSAGITTKSKRNQVNSALKANKSRTHKVPTYELSDEECVDVKNPQQSTVDTKKYTFSESDEESSGTEYRPTSLSNLQQRKANMASAGVAFSRERKDKKECVPNALTQRNKEDSGQDSDIQEVTVKHKSIEKKTKVASHASHENNVKSDQIHKLSKDANKTFISKSSHSSSKGSIKTLKQESAKKENKSLERRDDRENKVKEKARDKIHMVGRDVKIRSGEKMKIDSSKRERETENCAKESKKLKTDREKEKNKYKDHQLKNGTLDSSKRDRDVKRVSKSSCHSETKSSSSKGSSANSSKTKQSYSLTKERRPEKKRPHLSLSHADLFGDESPDEAEPIVVDDSDEEVEEVLVRKSADALKRGSLKKRKASELTPSSSDYEGDCGVDDGAQVKDELDEVEIDLSGFQDDLDFESDPMEECLRIFNESKDVKKEDKGRQTKQVLPQVLPH